MNKSFYLKILLFAAALVLVQQGYAYAEPNETQGVISDNVGRENPFLPIDAEKSSSLLSRVFGSGNKPTLPQPVPELTVQTVMLKFLDAKSFKTVLDSMLSAYGVIAVDAKSNSLIISDGRKNLDKIVEEIKRADGTPPQIMIEVVILDVQLEDDKEIGVNWDILSDKLYDISYRQNLTTRLGSTASSSTTIGNATAFNTTGTGGDFVYTSSGNIRNVIHLLQQKRDVEILASPRILLMSGKSASIETVEKIPYQEISDTSGGGTMTQTNFKDVGVTLEIVEAKVTDNNDIMLTVKPSQKVNTGSSLAGVPIIDERNAETTVLLRDGEIVVIGGLRRQEKTKEVDQIPILGDLPIVGFIFKSTNTVVNNSELLVILSPHIYKGEPLSEKELAKFNKLRNRPMLEMPDTWKQGMLPFEMIDEPNDAED
jgi:type II secretory pathway component GspD/PulD (secretin)